MGRLPRSGALLAAGLVAALALTACGGDASDADKDPGGSPAPAQTSPPEADGAGGGAGGPDVAALEGTWTGTSDGQPVVLSVASGKAALATGRHVCQGEVKDMGKVMVALKCHDGNTDRTMGTVESNDGKKLVVSWEAGAEDTLSKTDAAAPPPGLPELPTP
ncbi:hypothetical protein [Streptomyces pratensis]|uniref:hypothetical protein n=1 Tax=Streptomyces pratensis TaxID=1169025 RepID=UPI001931B9EA|nr:hypothetical protein [Streptomyces pratensis]